MTAATSAWPKSSDSRPRATARGRHATPVRSAVVLLAAAFAVSSVSAAGPGRLPGVPAFKTCAAAGPFWPTETLAVSGTTGWLACKEESRVVKLDLAHRKALRSVRIGVAGDRGRTRLRRRSGRSTRTGPSTRISTATGRILRRIDSTPPHAYNVWVGAGSVWVAADQGAEVVRISPAFEPRRRPCGRATGLPTWRSRGRRRG